MAKSVTVQVDVDEDELREAGWIRKGEAAGYVDPCGLEHCAENYCGEAEADMRSVLQRWHDEMGHRYALRFCDERPCKDLVKASEA